jgi:hypothetical protein
MFEKIYATDKAGLVVKAHISYNKGANSQCYHVVPRGYTLHVQPETRVQCDGYVAIRCIPTDGYKTFLLSVDRSSKKAETEAEKLAMLKLPLLLDAVSKGKDWKIID